MMQTLKFLIILLAILSTPGLATLDVVIVHNALTATADFDFVQALTTRLILSIVSIFLLQKALRFSSDMTFDIILKTVKDNAFTNFQSSKVLKNLTVDYREILAQGVLPGLRFISDILGLFTLLILALYIDIFEVSVTVKNIAIVCVAVCLGILYLVFYRRVSTELQISSENQISASQYVASSFSTILIPELWTFKYFGEMVKDFNAKYSIYLIFPFFIFVALELLTLLVIVRNSIGQPSVEQLTLLGFIILRMYPLVTRCFGSITSFVYAISAFRSVGISLHSIILPPLPKKEKLELLIQGKKYPLVQGRPLFISGPSGSGKTSSIKKSILVSGSDGLGQRYIDVMFYEPNTIFNEKIYSQLTSQTYERFRKNCVELGVPSDLETIEKKSNEFSDGEKQRLSIALSLCSSKRVMIFDEPTRSLDDERARQVFKLINSYRKFKVIVLITHNFVFREILDEFDEIKL